MPGLRKSDSKDFVVQEKKVASIGRGCGRIVRASRLSGRDARGPSVRVELFQLGDRIVTVGTAGAFARGPTLVEGLLTSGLSFFDLLAIRGRQTHLVPEEIEQ